MTPSLLSYGYSNIHLDLSTALLKIGTFVMLPKKAKSEIIALIRTVVITGSMCRRDTHEREQGD